MDLLPGGRALDDCTVGGEVGITAASVRLTTAFAHGSGRPLGLRLRLTAALLEESVWNVFVYCSALMYWFREKR